MVNPREGGYIVQRGAVKGVRLTMRVRSVTCFLQVDGAAPSAAGRGRGTACQGSGGDFGIGRFPGADGPAGDAAPADVARRSAGLAPRLWQLCAQSGFDYLSLGPVAVDDCEASLAAIDLIPQLIRQTENVFVGVLIRSLEHATAFERSRRTARVVSEIARTTPQGFGNLRLAMLAGVEPLCPFFPAAYHDEGPPAIALATESADLAVEAFAGAASLAEARRRLTQSVEAAADRLVQRVRPLADQRGCRFAGIDFSLAPFPEESRSIGRAIEELGVDCFVAPGTLFAASLLTDCLRRALSALRIQRPDDSRDGRQHAGPAELRRSVFGQRPAALLGGLRRRLGHRSAPRRHHGGRIGGHPARRGGPALRLRKPLTARLMPVPGARAGDPTHFDYPYLANCRVLPTKGCGCPRLFGRSVAGTLRVGCVNARRRMTEMIPATPMATGSMIT